jgi:hypothetical protein
MFESWRTGGSSDLDVSRKIIIGTFDWLCACYKKSPRYTKLPARTRSSHDRALRIVADYILNDGGRFGELSVKSISPSTADVLFEKLKIASKARFVCAPPASL